MVELRNKSKYEFGDISSELYRIYDWGNGITVRIDAPQWLAVSKAGHRIVDVKCMSHYIPMGWVHLFWEVPDDEPHFVR